MIQYAYRYDLPYADPLKYVPAEQWIGNIPEKKEFDYCCEELVTELIIDNPIKLILVGKFKGEAKYINRYIHYKPYTSYK